MSYQRQTDLVLTGSLNLLPQSALLPPEDAIALFNWRVDQQACLRSRLDRAPVAYPTGHVHTLFRREPAHRYIGADDKLFRDTTQIASGLDGTHVGLATMYGYTWVMNVALSGRDPGSGVSSLVPWGPTAPTAAPTITPGYTDGHDGGLLVLAMTYYYWVTFVDNQGQETNPSPEATYTPATTYQVCTLTRPSTSDSSVVGWNIYRGGNNLPQPYRLNADTIPLSQTQLADDGGGGGWSDYYMYSDDGLVNLGILMQTDSDPPPVAHGLTGPYYDHLLAWVGNTLYWSRQAQPSFWPGSDTDEGNHTPVGEDGETIVTTVCKALHARIYKEKSIWRLTGDPDSSDSTLELADPSIGLLGETAIDSVGDLDYFQAAEGIYTSNGYRATKVSDKLDPLFKGDLPPTGLWTGVLPMNQNLSARQANTLAVVNGRLYFSYCANTDTTPTCTLVYDILGARWYSDDRGFTALLYEGQGRNLLGAAAGTVYLLEQPQGSTINLVYQSGFRDQQQRDRQKTYDDAVVEYSVTTAGGGPLSLYAYYDDNPLTGGASRTETLGSLQISDSTPPQSGRRRDVLAMGGGDGTIARNCSLRIGGPCSGAVTIYSIELHYRLHPRDALTYDSGETDLGDPATKRCDRLQLDIDASGPFTYTVLTNQPGAVMASRSTATVAATGGRESLEIDLAADSPEGRLVRLALNATTAATFRLYDARFRYHRIGCYIDAGGQYSTLEIAA